MPTVTKARNSQAHRAQTLVDRLSAALRLPDSCRGEPLIVESQIAQTRSMHIVVIWDQWKNQSPAERSKIILEAYTDAKRLRGSTITVAMGLIGEEALRMGFLPYSIVTTRRHGDKASSDKLAKAMLGAGGVVVKIGSSTQLRFATLGQAEDAYRKLSQQVAGPYWAIVQEQAAAE